MLSSFFQKHKLILSLGSLALFLSFSSLLSIPYRELHPIEVTANALATLDEIELARKIEKYLENNLPGSNQTYRDVLNIIIAEGHNVWLTGGAVRDLLGDTLERPKDIDFNYDCSPDELEQILIENNVLYKRIPGTIAIHIGYRDGLHMEGVESRYAFHAKDSKLEFTVNTIFYHANTSTFEPRFKDGINDLKEKKLAVKEKDLDEWLYPDLDPLDEPSYKIFRFWKMRGKGYQGDSHLERFIIMETVKSFNRNPKLFKKTLLAYLGRHFSSFDQIRTGCSLTMGSAWCRQNCCCLYMQAKALDHEMDLMWNKQVQN